MGAITVLPSLLSADFTRLGDEIARCEAAGARRLHVDVMDGHFVPNLTIGPFIVEAMRRCTKLPLDVHLMITDPVRYARDYRNAGADAITIHVEAVGPRDMSKAIEAVRATGAQVGLAFNPDTDPALWFAHLALVDLAMFMTVYPGFGGQPFIPQVRPRVRATRAAFPRLAIQVDGGINRETVPQVIADGADRLVTGNAFFKDPDPAGFLRWAESSPRTLP
ncbi:MAG: ribulose-phosphate 3-epimerase [Planctomycetes bacterium]|nr:ribulose-phosphate 3-epimerase [Planctomycetota bacterium]